MRLNVSQATFELDLKREGEKFKVRDFGNAISAIRNIVVADLKKALIEDNYQEVYTNIFGQYSDVSAELFFKPSVITEISDSYGLSLIKNQVSRFFEEKDTKISKATMLNAYKLKLFNEFKSSLNASEIQGLFLYFLKEKSFLSFILTRNYILDTEFNENSASYLNAVEIENPELVGTLQSETDNEFVSLLTEFYILMNSPEFSNGIRNKFSKERFSWISAEFSIFKSYMERTYQIQEEIA